MVAETDLTKVKRRLAITDDKQDQLLTDLAADSKAQVEAYLNQDGAIVATVTLPERLGWIIRELTIRRFNRIGDEGKTSAAESDVSTSWVADDLADFYVYLDPLRAKTGGRGIARFI